MSNQSARKWRQDGNVYTRPEGPFECQIVECYWVGGKTWEWYIYDYAHDGVPVKACDSPVVTSLKCAKATAIYHARRLAKSNTKKGK